MCCAYPLARKNLKGRGLLTGLFTFTMIFSGGMIPKMECCVDAIAGGVDTFLSKNKAKTWDAKLAKMTK